LPLTPISVLFPVVGNQSAVALAKEDVGTVGDIGVLVVFRAATVYTAVRKVGGATPERTPTMEIRTANESEFASIGGSYVRASESAPEQIALIIKSLSLAAVLVCQFGCTQLATVRNVTPTPPSIAGSNPYGLATKEEQRRNPESALSRDLEVAARSWAELKRNPANTQAVQLYNYSTARAVSLLQSTGKLPRAGSARIGTGSNVYLLTYGSDIKYVADPRNVYFVPADELAISGKDYSSRVRRDGIGAPVLVRSETQLEKEKARQIFLTADQLYYGMTAVLDFQGAQVRLLIKDPLASDRIVIAGRSYPLAADFTIAPAALLAYNRPQRLGFIRMIRPAKYAYTARLVRSQPYDPNKIPVLMTHGLQDTPATWAPLLNRLRADPEINKHYQFWIYSYPSGYAFPYSAMLLREELDRIDKAYPNHKKIVLIGHSMGGLVSRLMVTDANLTFWNEFFGKPPDQVPMEADDKQLLERGLIFNHRRDVSRVIFISTPHRGSAFASNWIGRIGVALVKLPIKMVKLGASAGQYVISGDPGARKTKKLHVPTSIDTLSPKNRFVRTMNRLPIADHIPYHSIIGDRGRGDTPNSTDGVVPYWSSHLDGAQSEKIVPSGHPAHQNPQGTDEVDRILRLNLRTEM
jgi:pimeloyl-ACP methyl ester carboxylesterase